MTTLITIIFTKSLVCRISKLLQYYPLYSKTILACMANTLHLYKAIVISGTIPSIR